MYEMVCGMMSTRSPSAMSTMSMSISTMSMSISTMGMSMCTMDGTMDTMDGRVYLWICHSYYGYESTYRMESLEVYA